MSEKSNIPVSIFIELISLNISKSESFKKHCSAERQSARNPFEHEPLSLVCLPVNQILIIRGPVGFAYLSVRCVMVECVDSTRWKQINVSTQAFYDRPKMDFSWMTKLVAYTSKRGLREEVNKWPEPTKRQLPLNDCDSQIRNWNTQIVLNLAAFQWCRSQRL